ncbi:hypothetical protein AB0M32_36195 [Streptomyces sp. NPDC051985]|uniref:hypothetical protein n=1 Tax=Streptomyces sp. NPDC051985 TaxID=3155807 RepID=UPI00342A5F62
MTSPSTLAAPFALRLFTTPHRDCPPPRVAGVRYNPGLQVNVLPDGTTPLALTAFDPTRTSGGITGNGEVELMDFLPVDAAGPRW